MEWPRAGGSDNRWPRCVVGSGVVHLALLAACLLLQPVRDDPRSVFRVRLVDGVSVPDRTTLATDIARPPAPTSAAAPARPRFRRALPQTASVVRDPPAAGPPRVEPLSPSGPAPADVYGPPLAPTPSSPTGDAEPPAPGTAASPMVERPALPAGPPATSPTTDAPGSPASRDAASLSATGGGSGSSASSHVSNGELRGAFLLNGQGGGAGGGNGSGSGPGNGVGPGSGGGAGGAVGGGAGRGGGSAQLARGGNGAGSGGRNGEQLLRTIRRQIERVWTYPDAARRDGLEGTVWLRFRIAPDGSVEQVEVDRSSGHALLDDAAITAVRRAGPYPPYGGPIRYPFTYRLDR